MYLQVCYSQCVCVCVYDYKTITMCAREQISDSLFTFSEWRVEADS